MGARVKVRLLCKEVRQFPNSEQAVLVSTGLATQQPAAPEDLDVELVTNAVPGSFVAGAFYMTTFERV